MSYLVYVVGALFVIGLVFLTNQAQVQNSEQVIEPAKPLAVPTAVDLEALKRGPFKLVKQELPEAPYGYVVKNKTD